MGKNCIVFIDGHYLRLIGKEFGKASDYDINQFAITCAKKEGLWCGHTFYYTAPPYQSQIPTEDENLRKGRYDHFISKLKRIPEFTVREGRCQKIGVTYKQKAVDTHLVMDLTQLAIQHKHVRDIIVIVCDTDFVPTLNLVRSTGIRVTLYYYNDYVRGSKFSMSNHLFDSSDKQVLIDKDLFDKSVYIPHKYNTPAVTPPDP